MKFSFKKLFGKKIAPAPAPAQNITASQRAEAARRFAFARLMLDTGLSYGHNTAPLKKIQKQLKEQERAWAAAKTLEDIRPLRTRFFPIDPIGPGFKLQLNKFAMLPVGSPAHINKNYNLTGKPRKYYINRISTSIFHPDVALYFNERGKRYGNRVLAARTARGAVEGALRRAQMHEEAIRRFDYAAQLLENLVRRLARLGPASAATRQTLANLQTRLRAQKNAWNKATTDKTNLPTSPVKPTGAGYGPKGIFAKNAGNVMRAISNTYGQQYSNYLATRRHANTAGSVRSTRSNAENWQNWQNAISRAGSVRSTRSNAENWQNAISRAGSVRSTRSNAENWQNANSSIRSNARNGQTAVTVLTESQKDQATERFETTSWRILGLREALRDNPEIYQKLSELLEKVSQQEHLWTTSAAWQSPWAASVLPLYPVNPIGKEPYEPNVKKVMNAYNKIAANKFAAA